MLWVFEDTLGARRCSDVRRYSGCSPMFADDLDVRQCSGCSPILWMLVDALDPPDSTMVQKILCEFRVSASRDSVAAAVFAQSSPSPGGEARNK